MVSVFDGIQVIHNNYAPSAPEAFELVVCPNCSGTQMAVIAREQDSGRPVRRWLRCVNVNCKTAVVWQRGRSSPAVLPLGTPLGLTGIELDAWQEVRECLAVGAYTSAVMMARKLLLHVAVSNGLAAKDDKGRAPTFVAAVEHLLSVGVITEKMRPWIDRIKDVGNEANHEITPITQEMGMDVARFTEQLLKLAYEMDALMAGAGGDANHAHDTPETAS